MEGDAYLGLVCMLLCYLSSSPISSHRYGTIRRRGFNFVALTQMRTLEVNQQFAIMTFQFPSEKNTWDISQTFHSSLQVPEGKTGVFGDQSYQVPKVYWGLCWNGKHLLWEQGGLPSPACKLEGSVVKHAGERQHKATWDKLCLSAFTRVLFFIYFSIFVLWNITILQRDPAVFHLQRMMLNVGYV